MDPIDKKLRKLGGKLREPVLPKPEDEDIETPEENENGLSTDEEILLMVADHRYANWYEHNPDSRYSPEKIVSLSIPRLSELQEKARKELAFMIMKFNVDDDLESLTEKITTIVDLLDFIQLVKKIKLDREKKG